MGDAYDLLDPTEPPYRDPVDMIKVEPPSEAEQILSHVSEMITNGAEELNQSTSRSDRSSWMTELHSQRAQAWAQLAQAQAQYATALQLREIGHTLETSLDRMVDFLSDIRDGIERVGDKVEGV